MRRLLVVALLAAMAALVLAIPAQAIVHTVTPLCTAFANAGITAGGAPAFPVLTDGEDPVSGNFGGAAAGGPVMPANGAENSGGNSPDTGCLG